MPAEKFEETMTLDDDLFRQVTDQMHKRCDSRINDLRIIVHHHGLNLAGPRPHSLRQADGPRGREVSLGLGYRSQ